MYYLVNKIIHILVVFLCLAALYESWSIPFSVLLVIPLGVVGALMGATFRGLENDVYFQVALLTTVGLSAKNAILIVEFARQRQREGLSARDAAVEAAQVRLRPILMTSFAFILGVVPLVLGHGAGAEMRQALGVAVFSGMLGVTMFGIFLTPVFFYVIQWFNDRRLAAKGSA